MTPGSWNTTDLASKLWVLRVQLTEIILYWRRNSKLCITKKKLTHTVYADPSQC
jgi:hypothetical protein